MSVVAIDFDQTICHLGAPIEGAREALHRFVADGHTVIVFTARVDTTFVGHWLNEHRLAHHEVTNRKPKADIYIDDKGLRFESWPASYFAARELLG